VGGIRSLVAFSVVFFFCLFAAYARGDCHYACMHVFGLWTLVFIDPWRLEWGELGVWWLSLSYFFFCLFVIIFRTLH
jgi:hypothetical protein